MYDKLSSEEESDDDNSTAARQSLYASWELSDMQLVVLDYDLRIVLWSRGLVEAASGLRPALGSSFSALPFPSPEHRDRIVEMLSYIREEDDAEEHGGVPGPLLDPLHALQAAVVIEPNVIMHLVTPFMGTGGCSLHRTP